MVKLNDLLDILSYGSNIVIYKDDLEDPIFSGCFGCDEMNEIREKNYTVEEMSCGGEGFAFYVADPQ